MGIFILVGCLRVFFFASILFNSTVDLKKNKKHASCGSLTRPHSNSNQGWAGLGNGKWERSPDKIVMDRKIQLYFLVSVCKRERDTFPTYAHLISRFMFCVCDCARARTSGSQSDSVCVLFRLGNC